MERRYDGRCLMEEGRWTPALPPEHRYGAQEDGSRDAMVDKI